MFFAIELTKIETEATLLSAIDTSFRTFVCYSLGSDSLLRSCFVVRLVVRVIYRLIELLVHVTW